MSRISLLLYAALLPHFLPASAQVFDFGRDRIPVAALEGSAHFRTGDDVRWADRGFDDSRWPVLRLDRTWNDQGYRDYSGFAWYRFAFCFRRTAEALRFLFRTSKVPTRFMQTVR